MGWGALRVDIYPHSQSSTTLTMFFPMFFRPRYSFFTNRLGQDRAAKSHIQSVKITSLHTGSNFFIGSAAKLKNFEGKFLIDMLHCEHNVNRRTI